MMSQEQFREHGSAPVSDFPAPICARNEGDARYSNAQEHPLSRSQLFLFGLPGQRSSMERTYAADNGVARFTVGRSAVFLHARSGGRLLYAARRSRAIYSKGCAWTPLRG